MKISRMFVNNREETPCKSAKIRYSADRRVAVTGSEGTGQYTLVSPGGIMYVPQGNEDAVVISTDGGRVCLGVKIPANDYHLSPGELALYSAGGASIILKNNGSVIINGHTMTFDES